MLRPRRPLRVALLCSRRAPGLERLLAAGAEPEPAYELVAAVAETAPKVYELTEFLVDVLGVTDVGAYFPHRVTYHPTCHSLRMLGVGDRQNLRERDVAKEAEQKAKEDANKEQAGAAPQDQQKQDQAKKETDDEGGIVAPEPKAPAARRSARDSASRTSRRTRRASTSASRRRAPARGPSRSSARSAGPAWRTDRSPRRWRCRWS